MYSGVYLSIYCVLFIPEPHTVPETPIHLCWTDGWMVISAHPHTHLHVYAFSGGYLQMSSMDVHIIPTQRTPLTPAPTHTSINAPVYKHWHLRVLCIWICASIYRFLNDPAKLQRWWLWGESIFPWTLDRAKIFWLGSPAPSCVLGCLPTL